MKHNSSAIILHRIMLFMNRDAELAALIGLRDGGGVGPARSRRRCVTLADLVP
jgi:hypothetical protein